MIISDIAIIEIIIQTQVTMQDEEIRMIIIDLLAHIMMFILIVIDVPLRDLILRVLILPLGIGRF
jgi:hypothetical protein